MQRPRKDASHTTSLDLSVLGRAYFDFEMDVWDRSVRLAAGYFRRAAREALQADLDPTNPQDLARTFLTGVRSYYAEMATIVPVALDGLSRDLDQAMAPRVRTRRLGAAPPRRKAVVVDDVPVVLPVRIVDASEGWAVYFVDAAKAQQQLEEQSKELDELFVFVDTGGGRTPITILACDYRETDLGAYPEIGVGLFVRPRSDPSEMPGNLFLSLTVGDRFNVPRATELWGYRKTYTEKLMARYEATAAHFAVDRSDPEAFSISFPRFGNGRSTDFPIYTYGFKREGNAKIPLKSLVQRSAYGEGAQVGGNVRLTLGDRTKQKNCICNLGTGYPDRKHDIEQACVCAFLRSLGLPKAPAANGWLEHMSAPVSASVPCKPAISQAAGASSE